MSTNKLTWNIIIKYCCKIWNICQKWWQFKGEISDFLAYFEKKLKKYVFWNKNQINSIVFHVLFIEIVEKMF